MHMISSYRSNRKLRQKKSFFERDRTFLNAKKEYIKAAGNVDVKTATKEQLSAIRAKIILQRKRDSIKAAIIILALVPIVIFGVVKARQSYISSQEFAMEKNAEVRKAEDTIKRNKYLECIDDGDKWLRKNHWHNAIFQYRAALNLYPSDFDANYRLVLALTYRSQQTNQSNSEALNLVNKLIKSRPDDVDLYKVRTSLYYVMGDTIKADADFKTIDRLTN